MRTERNTKRAAGRPSEISPDRLLDAARSIFAERGFAGATTRELARRARCNVATIAYRFGNKEGLYDAVLARYLSQLSAAFAANLAQIESAGAELDREWPELDGREERRLCAALFVVGRLILLDEEMQKIVSRELMGGGRRIATLIARNGGGFAVPLLSKVEALVADGVLSGDLEPRLAVISLLGPLVYSCIAKPLIKIVYGYEHDEAHVRALCVHLTRTFFRGCSLTS